MKKYLCMIAISAILCGLNACTAPKKTTTQKKSSTTTKSPAKKPVAKMTKVDSLEKVVNQLVQELQKEKKDVANLNGKVDSLTTENKKLKAETAKVSVVNTTAPVSTVSKTTKPTVPVVTATKTVKDSTVTVTTNPSTKVAPKIPDAVKTVPDVIKAADAIKPKEQVKEPKLVPFMTSGRFFNRTESAKDSNFTKYDMADVVDTIARGNVNPNKWYTLSSGMQVQILHPISWLKTAAEAYVAVDTSINTVKKLSEAIRNSTDTIWSEKMGLTRNYYWSDVSLGNKLTFLPDYNGAPHHALVIAYKGHPMIKRSCGNLQLPIPK